MSGTYDSKKLMKEIKKHNGSYQLKTVNGEMLTLSMDGSMIKITDAKGGSAEVTTADVYQSNGVAHVIDTVSDALVLVAGSHHGGALRSAAFLWPMWKKSKDNARAMRVTRASPTDCSAEARFC